MNQEQCEGGEALARAPSPAAHRVRRLALAGRTRRGSRGSPEAP